MGSRNSTISHDNTAKVDNSAGRMSHPEAINEGDAMRSSPGSLQDFSSHRQEYSSASRDMMGIYFPASAQFPNGIKKNQLDPLFAPRSAHQMESSPAKRIQQQNRNKVGDEKELENKAHQIQESILNANAAPDHKNRELDGDRPESNVSHYEKSYDNRVYNVPLS